MKDKIQTLSIELNENFKEREDEIAGSLLALLSGEHVLFIGPPGTAKSLLAREMCKCVDGGNFFYYLLTRFTTPDEIFGPLSLSLLQEDVFSRKIVGYLPMANVSFLDEIFKANSSILNSLLTILNERRFHNGSEVLEVPLLAVFGASNELPEENESLEALYDRFLFRYYVGYVQDETNFVDIILGHAEDFVPSVRFSMSEIAALQKKAQAIPVDEDVLDAIVALRKEFRAMSITVSDRRWKKLVRLLRIAAAGLDRKSVDKTLLPLLQHVTWSKPEERASIRKLLLGMALSGGINPDQLKKDLKALHDSAELARDCVLPQEVTCRICERKFTRWKELKEHASANPDHSYLLPGKEEFYQLSRIKTAPHRLPNLLETFASMGRPVALALEGEKKELYRNEVEDLAEELRTMENSLTGERGQLRDRLAANIWLSSKDREDVLSKYDEKINSLVELRGLLADTEGKVLFEEIVVI
jgi:MoxR-like ATPase